MDDGRAAELAMTTHPYLKPPQSVFGLDAYSMKAGAATDPDDSDDEADNDNEHAQHVQLGEHSDAEEMMESKIYDQEFVKKIKEQLQEMMDDGSKSKKERLETLKQVAIAAEQLRSSRRRSDLKATPINGGGSHRKKAKQAAQQGKRSCGFAASVFPRFGSLVVLRLRRERRRRQSSAVATAAGASSQIRRRKEVIKTTSCADDWRA